MTHAKAPRVFISYSWESEDHKTWVRLLAERLRGVGVDARLDQWYVKPGESFTLFMEAEVVEADYVLIVCTPEYAEKSNARRGGVGYEQQIVSGQLVTGLPRSRFIPILRRGEIGGPGSAVPTHFLGTYAIDFRVDSKFDSSFEELLRALFSSPRFVPPALGERPSLPPDGEVVLPDSAEDEARFAGYLSATQEMVFIPEGDFYIDKYPVTREAYRRFADETGRGIPWTEGEGQAFLEGSAALLPGDVAWDADRVERLIPATNMRIEEALAYAAWAGKHLPTPEEWQMAALSGCEDKSWPYPWGETFREGLCNTRERGLGLPWPVIVSQAVGGCNPTGVCDLVGDVAEWAQTGEGVVFTCGGSYRDLAEKCSLQSKIRIKNVHFRNPAVGFRCAATSR